MQRTVEQIADEIGADTNAIKEYLTTHKIRASREDGDTKYYDEATQAYLRMFVAVKPTEKEKE